MFKTDGEQILDEFTSLVNPECQIPEFIVRLTGIHNEMVEKAPKFFEIAKQIIEFSEDCVFVAHNVGFDYGMLRSEFNQLGFDFRKPHLCTVRSAKYVLPGHASYSLGKLSKELGILINGRHRARGDAMATTELFQLIFERTKGELSKFIHQEINPKILHPNLDVQQLEEVPNKTGVYRFFDETNRLIYIGKSKHIRTRVLQHLKNASTKKAIEMRQEICRVEYELTGSELIALLMESQLIKQLKPRFNRALRKERFPFGLFCFYNEQGYLQFYIDRVSKRTDQPIATFGSKVEAVNFLTKQVKNHGLCQKLANLYATNQACFDYQIKQCFGACIGKEAPETYNARAELLVEQLNYEESNFFILDKGAVRGGKSIVMIENGVYRGYGQIPYYALRSRSRPREWERFIQYLNEDKDSRMIIQQFLRKSSEVDLVPF